MWNEPTLEELNKIHPLMSSRAFKNPLDLKIYEHFFLGGSDWYAAEYDPEYKLFFGHSILNSDYQNAEWCYINFDELRSYRSNHGVEVDRELDWKIRPAKDIEKIVRHL